MHLYSDATICLITVLTLRIVQVDASEEGLSQCGMLETVHHTFQLWE